MTEAALALPGAPLMTLRMIGASYSLSLRRLAYSKLMFVNIMLAALPVAIAVLIATLNPHKFQNAQDVHAMYEFFLRIFYLHFIIFFVANIFGFAVMRQETEDRTLHYLFLQPVRRWMLIIGKLMAYLTLASGVCITSLWLTYFVMCLPLGVGPVVADLFGAGRFMILVKESIVLSLGLLAYGALAMLMGSFFKSAFYALLLLGWEAGLPYLPSVLKLWTVTHYLHSLLPERLTEQKKLFELLGEPASALLSLAVLLGVSLVIVGISVGLFRFKECLYGES